MSADQTIYEILKEFYSRPGNLPQADGLFPLFIADMDSVGRQSEGLGWNELGDPERHVPMVASLPEVVREGDILRLFCTTTRPVSQPPISDPAEQAVDRYELNQEVVDKRILSFASSAQALNLPGYPKVSPGTSVYFYYSLEDIGSADVRYSHYREVLIDLDVPGGLDPDMSTPVNANLGAPKVKPTVIESSTTKVTVTIEKPVPDSAEAWLNQQAGDQLTLIWGNARYTLPRLETGDIGGRYEFDVPREVLESGGDGEPLRVQFEIRDRVQNYSRPSPAAEVTVRIDPDALLEPDVTGADGPGYELDLNQLNGEDVEVGIPAIGLAKGATLVLHWIAQTADGLEVRYESPPRVYNRTRDLIFDVLNVYATIAAMGTVRVFYTATVGGVTRTSRTRTISIIGSTGSLLPPVLVEAGGTNTVDLADITEGFFRVRIPLYPGQTAGDVVRAALTGQPFEGLPLVSFVDATVPVGGEGVQLEIPVTALLLRALLDGTLSLSYGVTSAMPGIPPRFSTNSPAYFIVDRNVPAFPPLTCEQVLGTGGEAYLPRDTAFAVFVVPQEARLTNGEVVTFRLEVAGSDTPAPYTQSIVFGGFPLEFIVPKAVIQRFDERDVQATYSVPR